MGLAENVIALQATKIVEYLLVDLFTDSGTCGTACSAAYQTAEQCAADSAKQGTDRSGDKANGGPGFGASQCRSGSATGTSDCADSSTGLARGIASCDAKRVTTGATNRMVHISASCRIRENGVA
ncbi:hypothetical protein [Paraburkholderia atlantica]|uniref:hypothetical protein n=1 Tax=Paraburkholderia atlantica TaxID=2654982 RepID=UPI00187B7B62|nr:hypothetical protein [Paraburkholderia atlantica]